MYDRGRRVYCKSQQRVGTIAERNYIGRPRRASYLVTFEDGTDYLTGASDLRGADYCCDGCGEWRTGPPYNRGDVGADDHLSFCFMCAGPPAQREDQAREYEDARRDYLTAYRDRGMV